MAETEVEPNSNGRSRRVWPALLAICMGFFVIQLDATIVNVALPAIQRDLGGTVSGLQWVIDSYTLALASILLTAGSIGDRVGARRVYLIGLLVFGVASAGCGAAPSLGGLIAARAVQGLGAATLLPCSLALIVHQFPDPRSRARALGVWGGVASVGLAAGPVLGWLLVTLVTWRIVFLVNVPICIATALLLRAAVGETEPRPESRTDLAGPLLAIVALGGLAGGLIETGPLGWLAPVPLSLLGVGATGAIALVVVEWRHVSPMLPLGVFRSPAFSAAVGVGLLFNLCLYGTLLCLSLFLQRSLGESALQAGALLLPLTVAIGDRRHLQRQPDRPAGPGSADGGGNGLRRGGGGADQPHRCLRTPGSAAGRLDRARVLLAGDAGDDIRRRGRPRRRSQRTRQWRPELGPSDGRRAGRGGARSPAFVEPDPGRPPAPGHATARGGGWVRAGDLPLPGRVARDPKPVRSRCS
ncbi:MAG TPA: MFS transporter [Candidatus Dormibacteraeota bacterium]|jgi:MFS family permease|nr:MFS transporter [Candidatus Dormibacteraeota bacterium]